MSTKLAEATIRNRRTGEGLDVVLFFDPAKKDPYELRIINGDDTFSQWYHSLPSPATILSLYGKSQDDQKAA